MFCIIEKKNVLKKFILRIRYQDESIQFDREENLLFIRQYFLYELKKKKSPTCYLNPFSLIDVFRR